MPSAHIYFLEFVAAGLGEMETSSPLNYGTPSSRGVADTPRTPGAIGTPHRVRADIRGERRPTVNMTAGSESVRTFLFKMCQQ